jgi:chromosome segregation ATPase
MQNSKKTIVIPLAALVIGLVIGLGIGHIQVRQEQKVSQDKIKEANKKIAFVQKRMAEENNDATVSIQQQCQGDLDKLQNEKKSLAAQLVKLKDQIQQRDMKIRESVEASARTKRESDEAAVRAKKELQEMERNSQELDNKLKKITGEEQVLQAELKKTTQSLGQCASDNAELSSISWDLLKKYRNKGFGTILAEKEPLTQIGKVQLEQLTQQYKEEIQKLKIGKNEKAIGNRQ